ncbi:MAG: COX15/CtaA family protein [Caulobacteraceae bacterium]
MRWSYNLERSQLAGLWLFSIAFLVFAMVVVGGATRVTGSGLSIVEWKPVTGIFPPLTADGWAAEFAKYQRIPQYKYVNQGMSLADFKFLYGWEWAHRLLGRLVGVVFAIPFALLIYLKRIPRRLIWRCWVILGLGGLQGLVGWWMVASGLANRVSVAPERLATHLGLALVIFAACVWTGLEAWFGRPRGTYDPSPRARGAANILVGLTFLQCLLGALVAGSRAGTVNTDWPLMNGRFFPRDYWVDGEGLWATLVHNQSAVQFNHRMVAYLLFLLALASAVAATRSDRLTLPVRQLARLFAIAVVVQAFIGVVTVRAAATMGFSLLHQVGAVVVLTLSIALAWRTARN